MKNHRLIIASVVLFVISCQTQEIHEEQQIKDVTKIREFDTTSKNSDSLDRHQTQVKYNQGKVDVLEDITDKLSLQPLQNLPPDARGIRLVIRFGWPNYWSGSPLALTIYANDSSHVKVETLEPDRAKPQVGGTPVRLQRTNYVSSRNFQNLLNKLDSMGFWQEYSFEYNDGWNSFDSDIYFIEIKTDTAYKLIVRETNEFVQLNYLVAFLKATHYNDTIMTQLEDRLNSMAHPGKR